MREVALIIIITMLLAGCGKKVSEVIEKYDNGNWKKIIVYRVNGEKRERIKAIEYFEDGRIKREIDLKKNPAFTFETVSEEKQKIVNSDRIAEPEQPSQEEYEYQGPYADLMNQPGTVTRRLEGEEKERVLEAMRRKREEQQSGEYFTETDDNGDEITKMRKVISTYEDGETMHEQIFVKVNENLELESDIEYYANGQLRTIVPYLYGKANGKWYNYYRDGSLKTAGSSKDGKHHGPYTQYYENGNPMMTGQFKAGKMDGTWQYFWENGKRKMETTFKDDTEIGPMKRYDESGNAIKRESPFRVGESYNFGDK